MRSRWTFLMAVCMLSGAVVLAHADSARQFSMGVCTHFSQGKGVVEQSRLIITGSLTMNITDNKSVRY